MSLDLARFFILWLLIIAMFTFVALLIFGDNRNFKDFLDVLIIFIESSLGSWAMKIYINEVPSKVGPGGLPTQLHAFAADGKVLTETPEDDPMRYVGVAYHYIYLLVNLVLMLNFVIAILSDTYSSLSNLKEGLYYNELIKKFPANDWDPKYGCLACASSPFNILLLFFIPYMLYIEGDEAALVRVNEIACYIVYVPLAVAVSAIFFVINTILVPIAYVSNALSLSLSLLGQNSCRSLGKRLILLV